MRNATQLDPAYKHLVRGKRYVVCQGFTDFDGSHHPPGEEWEFVGSSFLPYESGRSLFVRIRGRDVHIRMLDLSPDEDPQGHGQILEKIEAYVQPAT